nr:hypothetical protein [uncultured Shinella sp.]
MKVQTSIREKFSQQIEVNSLLKAHIDKLFLGVKSHRWHYESRLKQLESFAVKVETGRVSDPSRLEDFLACTLVVPNVAEMQSAVELVQNNFQIKERRPADVSITKKKADTFPFDDLRLYCWRHNDGTRPPDRSDEIVFEVQIKTFLQHAWGIATHDLSYKTDDVRWGKDRLVAHLKASIEYAELAIHETALLSKSEMLALAHGPTIGVAEVIQVLKAHWSRTDLPENLRSLAQTVYDVISMLKMSPDELGKLLDEKSKTAGAIPLNLSPYSVIVELLIHSRKEDFLKNLKRARFRLLLTPEMNLPEDFPPDFLSERVVVI